MDESKLKKFRTELEAMNDDDLTGRVEHFVWLSAFASNNPRSDYHPKCDATYDECNRRKKPWLYQRGWNRAFASSGYELSDYDLDRAKEETWLKEANAS